MLFNEDVEVSFSRTDEKFGDFSTNVAMQLAGKTGKNPRDIANQIVDNINNDALEVIEVAGPGFINIRLSDKALDVLSDSKSFDTYKDSTVVIETNNPNPFKAMHIGHAYNAIIADTIANLLELGRAKLYRVSYHGDIGLHVGKSMYSLLRYIDGDVSRLDSIAKHERNSFMSRMYSEGAKMYKEDDQAKAEILQLAKDSHTRTNQTYAEVYEICLNWSFEDIDNLVARLGNRPTEKRFLESDAEARGVKIVKDNTPGVFIKSQGAYIFEGSKYGSFDNAFVSSRGTGLYASRDLGLMQLKNEYYHPDKSYIVTAEEQKDYFKGVISAAELCSPDYKGQTINISTGTVKLPTGKMSSRSGEVVDVAWLFEEVSKAVVVRGGKPDDESVSAVLRYEFLRVRIGGDVVFDINQAVDIKGNSGPYLQYAHARARSILDKLDMNLSGFKPNGFDADERSLLRSITEFNELVEKSVNELLPHYICNYLYDLSQSFNRFYEKNRVIGHDRQDVRMYLVKLYADTIKSGLGILGINAPDKM